MGKALMVDEDGIATAWMRFLGSDLPSLLDEVRALRRDPVRCVLLRWDGSGGHGPAVGRTVGPSPEGFGARLRQALWEAETVAVAVSDGAIGTGDLGPMLACDLRIATTGSRFRIAGDEGLGLVPLLLDVLGRQAVVRLLMGDELSTADALSTGLVSIEVDPEAVDERLAPLLDGLRTVGHGRALARALRAGFELPLREATVLATALSTADPDRR